MASCKNARYCAQFLCVLSTSTPKIIVAVSGGGTPGGSRHDMSHQCDLGSEWRKSALRRPYAESSRRLLPIERTKSDFVQDSIL